MKPRRRPIAVPTRQQTRHALADLKRRGDLAWTEAIGQIKPGPVRDHVACIVWWDFFADRHKAGLDHHLLDPFKKAWDLRERHHAKPVSRTKLFNALVKVGYLPHAAWTRANTETDPPKQQPPRMAPSYTKTATDFRLAHVAPGTTMLLCAALPWKPPAHSAADPFARIDDVVRQGTTAMNNHKNEETGHE